MTRNTKAYRCLDQIFGRVIISRHLRFVEHIFPFKNSGPGSSSSIHAGPITQVSINADQLNVGLINDDQNHPIEDLVIRWPPTSSSCIASSVIRNETLAYINDSPTLAPTRR